MYQNSSDKKSTFETGLPLYRKTGYNEDKKSFLRSGTITD